MKLLIESRIRSWAALLLLALVVPLGSGCGYALVGRAQNLPEDVRRVYVRPLENRTPRSQIEQFLTSAIADELLTRPRFTVVRSGAEADAELTGSVTGFSVFPVTFDSEGRATDYQVRIEAQMAFRRMDTNQTVLWQNDSYLFQENYQLQISQGVYFDQEDTALREAAGRFAETVITDLLEGF